LTNAGTLSPGAAGVIQATSLTGDFTQTATGRMLVDTAAPGSNDKLLVSGSATVGGLVQFTSLANIVGPWTIVTASGAAPTTTATIGNIVLKGSVSVSGNDVLATVTGVDFGNGQTGNNASLGGYFNRSYANFSPNLLGSFAAFTTTAELMNAYNQLSPGLVARSGASSVLSGLSFANRVMSCPTSEGAYAFIREGQCVWAMMDGQKSTRKGAVAEPGSETMAARMAAGAQFAISSGFHAGFAIAYNSANSTTAIGQRSTGDEYSIGATVKYNAGPLLLAAALTGSSASYKNSRTVALGDIHETATSSPDISRIGGRLRSAYLFDFGSAYLKPMVDVDVQNVMVSAHTETGSASTNLHTLAANHWVASTSPAIELGGQIRPDGAPFNYRPFVRVGATAYAQKRFGVESYFEAAGPSFGTFSTVSSIDPVTLDVGAGLDVFSKSALSLKLSYEGRYGQTTKTHTGGFKAAVRF
jgi:uncharacterized protein YhjY with autotransporter beta-barrel domain